MTPNGYFQSIVIGTLAGFLTRLFLLERDYRNYPSYPHGYIIHLSLGAIAAALAAIAIPALLEREYTAITFLVMCAQEFRNIRSMERETLSKLERDLLVPRGLDYIEGIAKVFEARNYLVMLVALMTTGVTVFINIKWGIILGLALVWLSRLLMSGKTIGDMVAVQEGVLHFEGPLLMVDDIVIMNVGEQKAKEKIVAEGIGVVLTPKDKVAREVINNIGQRQAILHNIAVLVGLKTEVGEPQFTPLCRKNVDTGAVGIYVLPNEHRVDEVIRAVKMAPLLESAVVKPFKKQSISKSE